MNIRRNLLLILLLATVALTASAQFSGDGYYRVYNCGLQTTDKTFPKYYAWVEANRVDVSTAAGTGQKFEAIGLWNANEYTPVSAPASIIYVSKNGNYVELASQGTNVADITNYQLSMVQNGTANAYTLSSVVSGMTLYLWAYNANQFGHYTTTTIANTSSVAYKLWAMEAVSSTSDNYFGITPTLEVGGKYYQPFYAEFPFKFASTGMKAYYVDGVGTDCYTLKEIADEVKPGATPMLIECSSKDPSDNRLDLLRGTYTAIKDNKLSGVYFCCDMYANPTGIRTTFDANTMRVWNVKDGQLVLSTDTDNLHSSIFPGGLEYGYLNANQSYLVVPSTASQTLTLVTAGVENVKNMQEAKPVSYTSIDGKKITAPRQGQGPVIVRYSDGKSKTVVF